MRGMTAFGRSHVSDDRHEVWVEITSVNKKHLDISCRLPREFAEVEGDVRKLLAGSISRGQVQISVGVRARNPLLSEPPIDLAVVDGWLAQLQQIAERIGCSVPKEQLCLEIWRKCCDEEPLPGAGGENVSEVWPLMARAVTEALAVFNDRRENEGRCIAEDFRMRAGVLRECRKTIADALTGYADTVRQRLVALVSTYVPSLEVDDRLLREIVLHVDRADVSEELLRIEHHLDQLEQIFREKSAVGKHIEFVIQELLREYNTLGSKASVNSVSTMVIVAKTELEKMREQVQNVE